MEHLLLVTIVAVAALTAVVGFMIGDRRRRAASGHAGPRPCRSIGEALEKAAARHGRVLVLFLAKDETSMQAGSALAEDEGVVRLLGRPDLLHVVIRDAVEGPQIAQTLFEKYAKLPLPEGAVALLLDRNARPIEHRAAAEAAPLAAWLPAWVGEAPLEGRPGPDAPAEDDDSPVAFK